MDARIALRILVFRIISFECMPFGLQHKLVNGNDREREGEKSRQLIRTHSQMHVNEFSKCPN